MFTSNALCTKAKSMYGKRIQESEYHELCKKESVQDIVDYLKNHPGYALAMKSSTSTQFHRKQLEQSLQLEYYTRVVKLLKYVPKSKKEFYLQSIKMIEIRLVLDKILSLLSNDKNFDISAVPHVIEKFLRFDLSALVGAVSIDELKMVISKLKINHLLDYKIIDSIELYSKIENDLMLNYYDEYVNLINRDFKKSEQIQLLDTLYTNIELKNIEKIYRMKSYYDVSDIELENSICLTYSRLSKDVLNNLMECDIKDFFKILSSSKYSKYLDDDDYVYIEYLTENIKYNIARRCMRFSNKAPLIFMSYCILQQVEINNLKHIIEGVRYNEDFNNIVDFLIYM